MKNKGDKDKLYLYKKLNKGQKLTVREEAEFYNSLAEKITDTLKYNNPTEIKKLNNLLGEDTVKYLIELRDDSFTSDYSRIIWENLYMDKLNKIKKNDKEQKAKEVFKNLCLNAFVNNKNEKNYKTPNNFEEYVTEIKLLQEKYPALVDKKNERKKTIIKQKDWPRNLRYKPLSVTGELSKELYPIKDVTPKSLARVRTKLKRAKRKGFI